MAILFLCAERRGPIFSLLGDQDSLSISEESLKKNKISCRIVSPEEFPEKMA